MAKPYRKTGSKFWWIAPYIDGRQAHQSSGATDYDSAERKLKILEGRIAANAPITAKTDRESFAAVLELVRNDYKTKRRKSLGAIESRIDGKKGLMQSLGHMPTVKVGTLEINDYVRQRQEGGAADATINRELAIIRRGFRLAVWAGMVSVVPRIEMLPEDNARQGFFEADQFRAAVAHAVSPLLRDVLTACYFTGWRKQSVLDLEWRNVDLAGGCLRLWSQQTKNKKATIFPLAPFPELRAMLAARLDARTDLMPYVFHHNGHAVTPGKIQKEWQRTRRAAGLPGMRIHDLRRSAVRNLSEVDWSDREIMNIVGLKTMNMFIRYNIRNEKDILDKADRIAAAMGVLRA